MTRQRSHYAACIDYAAGYHYGASLPDIVTSPLTCMIACAWGESADETACAIYLKQRQNERHAAKVTAAAVATVAPETPNLPPDEPL